MPTASNARAEPHYWPAVPDRIWDSIREEFTTAADGEAHFEALGETGAMQRAVRVFIGEGTFCPGFQLKNGLFHEPVLDLFQHAMTLKVPHNVFSACDGQPSAWPGWCWCATVDQLDRATQLQNALAGFADRYRPVEKGR